MVFTLGLRHTFDVWQRSLALVQSSVVRHRSLRLGRCRKNLPLYAAGKSVNPYDAPKSTESETTVRAKFARFVFGAFVVVAFVAGIVLSIKLFLDRQYLLALATCSATLMVIPFCGDNTDSLRDRILFSLTMPFGLFGLLAGVAIYFAMFNFAWFESIFNSKGGGPFGLMMFGLAGVLPGGYIGYKLLSYVSNTLLGPAR